MKDAAEVQDNHDGTVSVKYKPKQYGVHDLLIRHDGVNISGSPFQFHVSSHGDGFATVYGPGLSYAVVGESASFTVSAKNASSG